MSAPILDENDGIVLNDDIVYEIIKQLKIHSFNWLFVNKHWSKVAVSVLWENPIRLCNPYKRFHLMQTYIACFNEEERSKLNSFFKNPYAKHPLFLSVAEPNNLNNSDDSNDSTLSYPNNSKQLFDIFGSASMSDHSDSMSDDSIVLPKPFYKYGNYLSKFKVCDLKESISVWAKVMKSKIQYQYKNINNSLTELEKIFMHSIMRQCQKLDCIGWNLFLADKYLLETIQPKITNLRSLTLYYNKIKPHDNNYYYSNRNAFDDFDYKVVVEIINNFKNNCQNLSELNLDFVDNKYNKYDSDDGVVEFNEYDLVSNEINSLVESQNSLKGIIVNHKCDDYFGIITFTLKLHANSLTKTVLGDMDFNKLSFDSLENCVNLESLGLKFSKGLELESIDHYTEFRNLKTLELSINKWSSKVTALIIRKAGDSLTSLTIGEGIVGHTINDDTLTALTECCPKINSLSISQISIKRFNNLFSYIKDLKLNTLKIYQVEDTIIKSKSLKRYIEQNSLLNIGMKKKDGYWNYYDNNRDHFKDLLTKHNTRLVLYRPFSHIEKIKIANFKSDDV